MKTALLPIIRELKSWLTLYYDAGLDPVSDAEAEIRVEALLIVDRLELLRAQVQKHQMESANE